MERYYPAIVEREPGSDWGVSFPDFPGCVTAGATPEEAVRLAHEALQFHIDGMLDDGAALPDPTPGKSIVLRAAGPTPIEEVTFLTLIRVTIPGRSKRINITIDEGLLDRIQAKTGNVSGFLADAARAKLRATG